jgi:glycine oxidase
MVAAGMYNPIVFKRLTKSWMVDELLPAANEVYKQLEELLQEKINNPIDIIRLFSSIEQQNDWFIKSGEAGFDKYLSNTKTDLLEQNNIPDHFGYGTVKSSGWIDTSNLLIKYREYLLKKELLYLNDFDYNELEVFDNKITYKEFSASNIIFCEGNQLSKNPFFNYLPLKPTKGELLTIEVENLNIDKVVNKGFFILPIGDNKFKVGATYNWKDLTDKNTEEGKQELIDKIKSVLPHEFKIIEHKAGVRPTVIDRRPLIGKHPEHKNMFVFNGMGTKGVMIAPYYAKQFSEHLINQYPLDAEVNIERFM